MTSLNASLQINVSPYDLAICKQLLERQISFWYSEFDEVVISVQSRPSISTSAQDFRANMRGLVALIESLVDQYTKVRYHFIDYSDSRRRHLARSFFGSDWIPDHESRGGPFYSYIDGIEETQGRFVLHLDADIILGGAPRAWISNAIELLNSQPNIFTVKPLSGPPTTDFELKQRYLKKQGKYKFIFDTLPGRAFLIDKLKLKRFKIPLETIPYNLKGVKWRLKNNFSPSYQRVEELLSQMMQKNGLVRIDYWGENEQDGCFTLHPLIKPNDFVMALPGILARIDSQDIPESQKGYYNVCNDLFDFSPYEKPPPDGALAEYVSRLKSRLGRWSAVNLRAMENSSGTLHRNQRVT